MTSTTSAQPQPLSRSDRESIAGDQSIARDGWILGLLLLLGAVLRLAVIQRLPFEQDELYTIVESQWLYESPLHPGIHARPLYYLIQHVLLGILPISHAALRFLPFVFGMAGMAATWFLARRLFGPVAAIVATSLAVVSPWHLHASGMARYWSLVYLLSTLFLFFLFRARRDGRSYDYFGALAVLLMGAATHPTFVFPLVGIVVGFYMVREDGRLRFPWPDAQALARIWVPVAVAFVSAYLLLTGTQGEDSIRNWNGRGLVASLRLIPAIIEWATPVFLVAGAIGAIVLCGPGGSPERRRWGWASVLGVATGLAALLAASFVTDVYADYAIVLLPLVFVSAGALIQSIADRYAGSVFGMAATCALVLAAAVAPGTVSYLSDGMRFDYRPAFAEIDAVAPKLTVLSAPIAIQRHYAPELSGIELMFDRESLDRVLDQARDVWVVAPVRRYGIWQDGNGELGQWLIDHCRLHSSSEGRRFDYRMYRTDLYRCVASTL